MTHSLKLFKMNKKNLSEPEIFDTFKYFSLEFPPQML
jgi:hypothetical protein